MQRKNWWREVKMTKHNYHLWRRVTKKHSSSPLRRVLLARQALSATDIHSPYRSQLELLEEEV